ncbi:MAG: hypothetical protein A3C43_12095 [Candidatus Schekmanbacteria bacterium RIFCSPHIGHO2_02_FULL_38_11]|uniref:Response regulatory domain-containing protein n=1 Tax=Candidatus Schekmanbacteria bacterium RIFCSPLOWO2_12_FULL_38_15 TaxID=1817883 RepID=A0A1F7SI46_9BACT|nr:MAG: hypothetical protein A2043_03875 [Candidatus Schekmanbacteria bacterium GWA2_38_9]OGL50791.1 MAG: hypothetical protein A3H37_02975 [Candidatus Schekmanbacteria bacterium RIFCSPLOWO2_02_FULL_38_14]OGL53449.1 MAG: hypothetical protein A3G31_08090 [Candidatus Schekmanbacteria bacterium RIFCSPLOWO2_12_FULL_38_15]OGL55035.1 MAG: hypothetical protein A3C43_12095 [Candidatus Schekmanbacteria bacterium RIFCSPHIGHO2_02_FULL_38_11]
MLFDNANLFIIDEENPVSGKELTKNFKKAGFGALFFSSCEQALRELKKTKVDLVITGIKSSQINGLEFLRRIKTLNYQADVIIYTEFGDVDNYIRASKLGAADFINKPIEFKEMLSIVKRTLKGKIDNTKIATTDRRKHPRFSVDEPAYIVQKQKEKNKKSRTSARIVNLSLSGLLIEYCLPFEINKILEIHPVLGGKKIITSGTVRNSKENEIEIPAYYTGVEFTKVSANHHNVIQQYLEAI